LDLVRLPPQEYQEHNLILSNGADGGKSVVSRLVIERRDRPEMLAFFSVPQVREQWFRKLADALRSNERRQEGRKVVI
jgi:hypothetical protein